MKLRNVFAAAAAAIVSFGLLTATAGSSAASAAESGGAGAMRAACPTAPAGDERCFALFAPQLRVNAAIAAGVRGAASHPSGLSPADIAAAYKLPTRRNPH
jgi:hypothetical protein